MNIEGFIDFTNNNGERFFENENFDKSLKSHNYFFGVKGFEASSYNKYLIHSFDPVSKECKSLNNFLLGDLFSLESFKELLSRVDNKLRVSLWHNEFDQSVHIARELFGTLPLYYLHVPDKFFIFSTNLSFLVGRKIVKPYLEINYDMVNSYHRFRMDLTKSSSNSFYKNIKSVLPGHMLSVSRKEVSTSSFVTFDTTRWSHLSSSEDYGNAVKEVFAQSVKATSNNKAQIVASHLSGGLDSSSVSTMFKHLFPATTLHTLFHKNASKDMDESYYSQSVAKKIGSIHHEVPPSEEDFDMIRLHTSLFGEPEVSTLSPSSITTLLSYARDLGCTLLLRGTAGDSVIGNGMEILHDSFQQKNWGDFNHLLKKRVDFFSLSNQYPSWDSYSFNDKYDLVLQNFIYKQAAGLRGMPLSNILDFYIGVNAALGINHSYFLKRGITNFIARLTKQGVNPPLSILKDEFINSSYSSTNELLLSRSLRGSLPQIYQPYFEDVFTPRAVSSTEQQFVLGEFYGLSNCSPFLDKDLFELCMTIPDRIKYGDGKGRSHLRDAMKGLLPEEVRNRSSKATLTSSHGQKITLRLYNQAQSFLHDSTLVWQYVDLKKFNEQVSILKNEKIPYVQKARTWFHITRTISLALWLEWLSDQAK